MLDRALSELDRDERSGPLLRAAGLSLRIELTDIDLVLRVAPSDADDHHLRWSFGDSRRARRSSTSGWTPRPPTRTSRARRAWRSRSLAARSSAPGESRVALLYLPALRLVVEPYRRLVRERYPHLALT